MKLCWSRQVKECELLNEIVTSNDLLHYVGTIDGQFNSGFDWTHFFYIFEIN